MQIYLEWTLNIVLLLCLGVLAWEDRRYGCVTLWKLLITMFFGVWLRYMAYRYADYQYVEVFWVEGIFVIAGLMIYSIGFRKLGLGDVMVFICIGIYKGVYFAVISLAVAMGLVYVGCIVRLLRRRRLKNRSIALVPYLLMGVICGMAGGVV